MSVRGYTVATWMFSLLIILTANLSSGSVLRPAHCRHQSNANGPSRWARRLQAEHQILNLNPLTLVALHGEVRRKLSELAGLIDDKKNEFTRDELRRSYNYYDLALKTMNYDYLVSSTHTSTNPDNLSGAYNLFQRLALALEVVRLDMDHHEDMTVRTRDLWRRLEAKIDDLLKLFYVGLGGEGELVDRHVLPREFWCVEESVSRDFRDFLVLRHVLQVANLYIRS